MLFYASFVVPTQWRHIFLWWNITASILYGMKSSSDTTWFQKHPLSQVICSMSLNVYPSFLTQKCTIWVHCFGKVYQLRLSNYRLSGVNQNVIFSWQFFLTTSWQHTFQHTFDKENVVLIMVSPFLLAFMLSKIPSHVQVFYVDVCNRY